MVSGRSIVSGGWCPPLGRLRMVEVCAVCDKFFAWPSITTVLYRDHTRTVCNDCLKEAEGER